MTDDENADNDSFTADVTHLKANDLGVSEISTPTSGTGLSSSEQVTVIITNYGGASQSNFDISLDIDGTLYTETVAGPIQPNSSLEYTFSQTLDLSEFGVYTLTVFTSLENDYDTTNDSITATINNSNCAPTGDMSYGDGIHLFELADVIPLKRVLVTVTMILQISHLILSKEKLIPLLYPLDMVLSILEFGLIIMMITPLLLMN